MLAITRNKSTKLLHSALTNVLKSRDLRARQAFYHYKPINPYPLLHRRTFSASLSRAFFDDDDNYDGGGLDGNKGRSSQHDDEEEALRNGSLEISELGAGAVVILGTFLLGIGAVAMLPVMGRKGERDIQARKKAEEDKKKLE
jgi:hypothetical protein